jgi:membrane fusion protein (multidrug efflux system)
MKIGDKVKITVDAIPDKTYIGVIEAISNATGSQYSLVPQNNATGNFVKVEQRLPVKIRFTKDNSAKDISLLRAGLNVECEMLND